MRKTPERSQRRVLWLVIGLAVAAVLSGSAFGREALRVRQIDREIRALEAEAEALRVHNFQVASLRTSLESGEFLEREARTKLGLQKEGERVVVLRKEEHPPAPSPEEGLAGRGPSEDWSNAKKWWNYFADPRAFDDYVQSRNAARTSAADHPPR